MNEKVLRWLVIWFSIGPQIEDVKSLILARHKCAIKRKLEKARLDIDLSAAGIYNYESLVIKIARILIITKWIWFPRVGQVHVRKCQIHRTCALLLVGPTLAPQSGLRCTISAAIDPLSNHLFQTLSHGRANQDSRIFNKPLFTFTTRNKEPPYISFLFFYFSFFFKIQLSPPEKECDRSLISALFEGWLSLDYLPTCFISRFILIVSHCTARRHYFLIFYFF